MNWRIILLAASLASSINLIVQGDELDYDTPEGALLHDMEIMDADVRYSALAGYKRRFDLSDDEFSDRLVKMATVTTNGNNAWLRGFTVCAICDFGTTNALDFLANEAINGSSSAGIKGYGIITDFDDRFFALAEKILADKRIENSGRRDSAYRVFKSLISYSQMRGKEIPLITRKRAREALLRHSLSDSYHRVLIDMILGKNDFEEIPYKNSPERLQIARVACDDPGSSDYARGYFRNVLEQMGKEDLPDDLAVMPRVAPKTTEQQPQAKPPDLSYDKELAETNATPSFPPTSAQQHCLITFLIMLAFLVSGMVLAIVVFHRRRKRLQLNDANRNSLCL